MVILNSSILGQIIFHLTETNIMVTGLLEKGLIEGSLELLKKSFRYI